MLHRDIRYRVRVPDTETRVRIGSVTYTDGIYTYIQVYYRGEERDYEEGKVFAAKNNVVSEYEPTGFSTN